MAEGVCRWVLSGGGCVRLLRRESLKCGDGGARPLGWGWRGRVQKSGRGGQTTQLPQTAGANYLYRVRVGRLSRYHPTVHATVEVKCGQPVLPPPFACLAPAY